MELHDYRTNNHIEGWHTRRWMGKLTPIFLRYLKKDQASLVMKLEQLELGGRALPRLLKATNKSQHCLSNLRMDSTTLVIS